MSARVLLASGFAAIVGALVWGGITYETGYEIGYVAWGIGLLVGGAAVSFGGRGSTCGMVCAAMALVSIFAGKIMAVQFSMPGEIRKLVEPHLTKAAYNEAKKDAADFAQIGPNDHAGFMVTHGYTKAAKADQISAAELADFEHDIAPGLQWIESEKPTYVQWRERKLAEETKIIGANVPVRELVVENLGAIDVLFGLLGIATAYRIPARRKE